MCCCCWQTLLSCYKVKSLKPMSSMVRMDIFNLIFLGELLSSKRYRVRCDLVVLEGTKDDQEGHQSQILLLLDRSCSAERSCFCNWSSSGTSPASFATSMIWTDDLNTMNIFGFRT